MLNGLAVIADKQIKGQGRGQNVWISPKGCAMTSFQIETSLSSSLGQSASLLQHLVALSVVQSLGDLLNLNLKWPNDIYYGKNVKMGGVVIFSSIFRDRVTFNIGLGFNLDNSKPTLSFNDLLTREGLQKLSREEYFARVFNQLEAFMDLLDQGKIEEILQIYHKLWLHQNQKVTLITENDNQTDEKTGTVKSIDQDGFLIVELDESLECVSVQPGNNSFDMMQGLILPKKNK